MASFKQAMMLYAKLATGGLLAGYGYLHYR